MTTTTRNFIHSVPLEDLLSDSDLNSIREHFGSRTWIAKLQDLHIQVKRSNNVYNATISNVPECLQRILDYAYSLKYQEFPCRKKDIVDFIVHHYGIGSFPTQDDNEVTLDEELKTLGNRIDPLKSLACTLVPTIAIGLDIKKLLLLQLVGGCSRWDNEGERIRGDINILLMGQGLENLLKEIASSKLQGAYMTGQESSDADLIDALNKDGGFVCIHEILEMGDSQLVLMHEAMEDNTLTTMSSDGLIDKNNVCVPILASDSSNKVLPISLSHRFDLILPVKEEIQIDQTDISSSVSSRLLWRYINTAKQFDTVITEETATYIESQYKEYDSNRSRIILSIIRLSQAMARLRFSNFVEIADAQAVMRLIRHSSHPVLNNSRPARNRKPTYIMGSQFETSRKRKRTEDPMLLDDDERQGKRTRDQTTLVDRTVLPVSGITHGARGNISEAVDALKRDLERVSLGQKAEKSLIENTEHLVQSFICSQLKESLTFCDNCKRRWFDSKCPVCIKDNIKFTHQNDMDPLVPVHYNKTMEDENYIETFRARYSNLVTNYPLNNIEEALIAKNSVILQCFRLKGGSHGFKGNVISFPQRSSDICTILPRLPSELKVLIIRAKGQNDNVEEFKDFVVRRENIQMWLEMLIEYSPIYADVKLSLEKLSQLPEEGSIYNLLSKDVSPPSNEEGVGQSSDDERIDGESSPIPNDKETNDASNETVIEETEDNDFGVEGGPGGFEDEDGDDIVRTGFCETDPVDVGDQMERLQEAVLSWPQRDETPNDEYSTPWLLAASFPTLFPCGSGDVTNNLKRIKKVSLNDAAKHYLTYYDDRLSRYPFAENPRFLHYIQDVDERNRIQSLASVYMKKNTGDANMTLVEFKERLRQTDALFIINRKIQKFAARVLGSPAYFTQCKKELLSLIEKEKSPTIWFTLSLPNFFWEDLRRLYGDESMDLQFVKEQFLNNPHINNEMFVRRARKFLETIFGEEGLGHDWIWWRYEYQRRGNIHLHGMVRIKNAPDLPKLSTIYAHGVKAILALKELRSKNVLSEDNLIELDKIFIEEDFSHHEIAQSSIIAMLTDVHIDNFFIDDLFQAYVKGKEALNVIVTYRDYLITSFNKSTNLPSDAEKEVRDECTSARDPKVLECHPCCTYMKDLMDSNFDMMGLEQSVYAKLIDNVERHRHNPTYCMRDGRCRFGFPRPLTSATKIKVKDVLYTRGAHSGSVKCTNVEIMGHTNDRWLNCHMPLAQFCWGANCDFNTLVDERATVEYIAKYCTKSETPSPALEVVVRQVINDSIERGNEEAKGVLRTLFNRTAGRRDKSSMETCHLLLSTPYVECSHRFETLNLISDVRRINTEGDDEEEALQGNLLDLYGQRMSNSKWLNDSEYVSLTDMNLSDFVHGYYKSKQKIKARSDSANSKPLILVFSPETKGCREPWKYAYLSLIKFKPWVDSPATTYDGTIEDVFDFFNGNIQQVTKDKILSAFESYFRNPSSSGFNKDDPVTREINRLLAEGEVDCSPELNGFSLDSEQDEEDLNHFLYPGKGMDSNPQLQCDANFQYSDSSKEATDLLHEAFKQRVGGKSDADDRRKIHLEDFDPQDAGSKSQMDILKTFLSICGLDKDSGGNFLPSRRRAKRGNVLLVPGPAGTGKSFLIDAIVTEILERSREKGLNDATVLVLAPTGKAALQCGGCTLHSANGLSIPISHLNITGKNTYKDGSAALNRLQDRLKNCVAIVIDEYSMVSSQQLYWINSRLRQGRPTETSADEIFSGLPTVIFGDPGQLPPVGGTPLHLDKTSSNKQLDEVPLLGHKLYKSIPNVLYLTHVRRQSGIFRDILLRIRDGKTTLADWEELNATCSWLNMDDEKKERFGSAECCVICLTNPECNEKNLSMLMGLGQPILKVEAEHDSATTRKMSSELFRRLESAFYLCVGARVMLLWNLGLNCGLVNGSSGTVIEIFEEYVIVDFPSYTGQPFFEEPEKSHHVPIFKQTASFHSYDGSSIFRKQYPLMLSWAITAWKSQGMTCEGLVYADLGQDSEKSIGVTYVMLSRVTEMENLCIGNPIPFDRLDKIGKSPAMAIRLAEEERLKKLCQSTKKFYSLV